MKVLGQPVIFVAVAASFLLLAVAHPMSFLQARHAALDGRTIGSSPRTAAARYVEDYVASDAFRAAVQGEESIGYVSEAPIDVRVGGPLQARYYLAQFALAPLLLELEPNQGGPEHRLVLANFQTARELEGYLERQSREVVVSINDSIALTTQRERK